MSKQSRRAPRALGWLLTALALTGLASAASAAVADHLIISEMTWPHPAVSSSSSYITIVNPTAFDIEMGGVHLTDATYAPNVLYANLTLSDLSAGNPGGGITSGDFHGRFPDGYVLAAGDSLVISIAGQEAFLAAYGFKPDFELVDVGAVDDVPELIEVFPGSMVGLTGSNLPALATSSESLILYSWDGSAPLVQDLDYVFWGTNAGIQIDKTGLTVRGETYLDDTAKASQTTARSASIVAGNALKRLDADEGVETDALGNGSGGHDETSEVLSATWQYGNVFSPPTPPASWWPAAPQFTAGSITPTVPNSETPVTLSVTVESFGVVSGVTFRVSVDGGAETLLTGALQGGGVWTAQLPAQAEDSEVTWYAVAVNSGGGSAVYPAGAPLFTGSWTTAAPPPPSFDPPKLLITEVATIGTDQEFVEISNPGSEDVDMSDYYLTDAIYFPNNTVYWNITQGVLNADTIGGGAYADFHSRFPDGFMLAAGDTIVVSLAGSGLYSASFGFLPDLELYEDDAYPDNVTDMRWVFGDETNNSIINRTGASPSTPTLTNGAEIVILYHWDGVSDGVTDIDVFSYKDPSSTSTSFLFSKTGVTVGTFSYLPDTAIGSQTPYPSQAEFGSSYQRLGAGEGAQIMTGGNGVDGRDETSEDFANTFRLAAYDPSRPGGGAVVGGGEAALLIEPKTFLPTMGETFPIRFVSNPQSETRLRIFDLEGRMIIELFNSTFNGAPSVLIDAPTVAVWDGRDATYQRVRAGMYIAHLSVVSNATGEEITKTAPVVVATRLSK